MIIRKISRNLLKKEPYQIWNAFIDLLANEEMEKLNDIQKAAHLCFWYDSEVQNGGHFQYFENIDMEKAKATVSALVTLGAAEQSKILKEAIEKSDPQKEKALSASEFVRGALEGDYDEQDKAYHKCSPTIIELLQKYLNEKQDNFVEVI